jgi:CubicO group peptidase (beta-lactamase class C family)
MTTNHLTAEQIASGGPILGGRGWDYVMSVVTAHDDLSPTPGRYGWEGGYGTSWFNDTTQNRVAILMSQTSDVLFNRTLTEFGRLPLAA